MALCGLLAVDCCLFIYGPANMTHKLSSACAETILSYHNSLRDLDYVSVLYQFTFAAITASALARVN